MDEEKFSNLIDCSEEEFSEYCSDKSLGYLLSFKLFLASAYQNIVSIKEDLVKKIKDESLPEDSAEVRLLNKIYVELMKLEHRILLCNSFIGKKSKQCEQELD